MDPMSTLMAALGIGKAATGLFKSIFGGIQQARGKRQRENILSQFESGQLNPPEYDPSTPMAFEELSGLYENYLAEQTRREGMPGQDVMEAKLREMAESRFRGVKETARTSTQALGAYTDISSQLMENLQQLEVQGARDQAERELQAMQMYGQSLGQLGQYQAQEQQQEWYRNQFMPWKIQEYQPAMTRLSQAQSDWAAGAQNLSAGIGDMVSGAAYGAGYYYMGNQGQGGGNQGQGGGLPNTNLPSYQDNNKQNFYKNPLT
jgi:hypothetical protein